MKCVSGFSLFSFLVYLSIFSLLTFLVCYTTSSLIIPSLISMRRYQTYISLHIAADNFIYDVRTLSQNKQKLKYITPQELIWLGGKLSNNKDICWRFHNHKLERIEGIYKDGWKEKKTHCIINNITDGSFSVDQGIMIFFAPVGDPAYKVKGYVAING